MGLRYSADFGHSRLVSLFYCNIFYLFSERNWSRGGQKRTQKVASSDGKGYWCDICSRGFSRLAALDKHKNFSHDDIRKAASGAGDSLRHQKRSSASRFRFKCPICNRRFVKRSSFISHQKQHGKTKNVRKDKGTLKRLKASANKQRISYPCDECTKSFPSASLLRAHTKLSHKKDKLSHPDEPVACRQGCYAGKCFPLRRTFFGERLFRKTEAR